VASGGWLSRIISWSKLRCASNHLVLYCELCVCGGMWIVRWRNVDREVMFSEQEEKYVSGTCTKYHSTKTSPLDVH
jgi:hypothetical protein